MIKNLYPEALYGLFFKLFKMILKKIPFLPILLFNLCMFAQTKAEREKIVATYNMEEIDSLRYALNEQYIERKKRISSYLNSNETKRVKTTIGDKTYYIYDIIDGKPQYITTENVDSAIATKTDELHPGGGLNLNLEGENMILGIWDSESALGAHVEFEDDQAVPESRIIYAEYPGGVFGGVISDHATHVAGTIAAKGVDPNAKGMAPKVTIKSYDFDRVQPELATEAANGLLLSNHSWGIPIFLSNGAQQLNASEIGAYTSRAKDWDDIVYSSPYSLIVGSAGNEGNSNYLGGQANGYDKLTGSKTAKNILVVASAFTTFNSSTGELQFFSKSGFSSQGPTDDFRIKPDITGRGEGVYSTSMTSNSAYTTKQGTSMSSPNVSGSLVLLQEYYNNLNSSFMLAATLKGLVCHTAKDDNIKPGPDPFLGWGMLDAEKAAQTIAAANSNAAVISELSIANGETYTLNFTVATGSELKATICWTDPSGVVSNSPNNVLTPRLVNDLDLTLEDPNSTVFTPWKLNSTNVAENAIKGNNSVDNIERIDILNPVAGNYTLNVTHKGLLTNDSQNFSLIITGANITLSSERKNLAESKIWPIPATEKLNIDFKGLPEKSRISLLNINGNLVFEDVTKTLITHYSINTSKFAKGIYFLNISSGNLKFTKKIILK